MLKQGPKSSRTTILKTTLLLVASLALIPNSVGAALLGDTVKMLNTLTDTTLTDGEEKFVTTQAGTIVDPGVELPFISGTTSYDFDFTCDTITITLADDPALVNPVLPPGTVDRYYFGFNDNRVTGVDLVGSTGLNAAATVEIYPAGYELTATDLFNLGMPVTIPLPNGGFSVSFNEGTDLTTIGVTGEISIETVPVPEPGAIALIGLGFLGALVALRKRV